MVSVSMLTEGWDANTVTHILGVRAFGTQLLCEQVVGRALRRTTYVAERRRTCSRPSTPRSTACRSRSSRCGPVISHAGAAEEGDAGAGAARARRPRAHLPARSPATATSCRRDACTCELRRAAPAWRSRTAEVPTKVEIDADRRRERHPHARRAQGAARRRRSTSCSPSWSTSSTSADDASRRAGSRPWLFPQILRRRRARGVAQCLTCKDDCFPQMLLLVEYAHTRRRQDLPGHRRLDAAASSGCCRSCSPTTPSARRSYVDFDTTRPVW